MTRDDIIKLAQEAGVYGPYMGEDENLERFAALIAFFVAEPLQDRIHDIYVQLGEAESQLDQQYKMGMEAEREACAKVCDDVDKESLSQWPQRLATMIRARGETK
jgi:hypothetical protein